MSLDVISYSLANRVRRNLAVLDAQCLSASALYPYQSVYPKDFTGETLFIGEEKTSSIRDYINFGLASLSAADIAFSGSQPTVQLAIADLYSQISGLLSDLHISGDATINGSLSVGGGYPSGSGVTIDAAGNINASGELVTGGLTTGSALFAGDVTVLGTLSVDFVEASRFVEAIYGNVDGSAEVINEGTFTDSAATTLPVEKTYYYSDALGQRQQLVAQAEYPYALLSGFEDPNGAGAITEEWSPALRSKYSLEAMPYRLYKTIEKHYRDTVVHKTITTLYGFSGGHEVISWRIVA